MAEKVVIDVCHSLLEDYRNFLENLPFPSFFKLMEAARHTNESISRTSRSNLAVRPNPSDLASRKRPMAATLKNGNVARPTNLKKPIYGRKEHMQFPILPPLLCDVKKAIALLE